MHIIIQKEFYKILGIFESSKNDRNNKKTGRSSVKPEL